MGLGHRLLGLFLSGIILYVAQPIINEIRLLRLQDAGNGVFLTFFWYMLIPMLWIILGFTTILTIRKLILGVGDVE